MSAAKKTETRCRWCEAPSVSSQEGAPGGYCSLDCAEAHLGRAQATALRVGEWVSKFQMNAEVNGALFAAAPDLLEAALAEEKALAAEAFQAIDAHSLRDHANRLRSAAIAKARGES